MTYKNILDKLVGKWIHQRTSYFIHNQQIDYHQEEIKLKQIDNIYISTKDNNSLYQYELSNKINNQKIYYIFSKQEESEFGKLHKITNDEIKYYRFTIHTHNCIKIESVRENISYNEYIYLINNRFKITISILKRGQKYLATSFISEIKIFN
uniref:Chromophore lyase CpcS/CpeS homolog n=1 Tax=Gracilaria tenuistipitata var. liui TaxID=285951 RepID=CPXS_GRATL|nr:conserved hypothetical plastid protein [Gracilaria tenuistipitata var. liui]Q6B8Q1.1 RecName: Full=Chromophore lyase CpcS/CpeS homolog [Gracilaria tenuistipitata var. liui]AAT79734.1 conserved hypothetical plastid protein [Gracilaria tenuistipitata var. liui]